MRKETGKLLLRLALWTLPLVLIAAVVIGAVLFLVLVSLPDI